MFLKRFFHLENDFCEPFTVGAHVLRSPNDNSKSETDSEKRVSAQIFCLEPEKKTIGLVEPGRFLHGF